MGIVLSEVEGSPWARPPSFDGSKTSVDFPVFSPKKAWRVPRSKRVGRASGGTSTRRLCLHYVLGDGAEDLRSHQRSKTCPRSGAWNSNTRNLRPFKSPTL